MTEHSETDVAPPAEWATHASSAANAGSLAALADVDPTALGGPALVDAIVASEKALSLLAGTQMRLLAALAQPFVAGDPMRLAARLARKNCVINDDNSDEMVQLLVPDAAISLASAEVAAALRISPVTAGIRVREAETMTTVLAPTLNALEGGVLDRGKARIIAEHCEPLSPDNKTAVQGLVLPLAGPATNSELRDIAGQAVITVDPEGCDERHQAAAARRELAIKALPDAMANLKAFLPADGAVKIFQLTDLLATATAGSHGDNRGIGARRIDALVDIADQLLTLGHLDLSYYLGNPLPDHGSPRTRAAADDSHIDCGDSDPLSTNNDSTKPADAEHDNEDAGDTATEPSKSRSALRSRPASPAPTAAPSSSRKLCGACGSTGAAQRSLTRQGRRPHLSITLGLGTLAGLDNLPGTLAGFGAIPPGIARSIAKSAATITALLTDPETGSITDAGALVYRPRQALRDQIAALLGTCQFPSCRQPVWRCDIDHREPFDHHNPEQGGHTTRENTGPYCRRHHLFKHHTEWQTRPDPSSSVLTWISPTGHRYVKGRIQATPPDIWVATVGTDIAERLDNIRATVDVLGETKMAGSVPEELLTAMLLRHELNRPSYEYDPVVGNGLHNDSAVNNNTDTDTDNSAHNNSAHNNSAHNNSAHNNSAHNNSAHNNSAGSPGDATVTEPDASNGSAPNAQSWPTIDDPPPF